MPSTTMNNDSIHPLIITFSSTFVGATIAFLTTLVVFTYHNEIQNCLLCQGLIVPNQPRHLIGFTIEPHGPEPTTPQCTL